MRDFIHWFDQDHVKKLGIAALLVLIGVAIGNSHRTKDALDGQAKYFQQHEQVTAKKVAGAVEKKVRHEDAAVIGTTPEILKATVDAVKPVEKK